MNTTAKVPVHGDETSLHLISNVLIVSFNRLGCELDITLDTHLMRAVSSSDDVSQSSIYLADILNGVDKVKTPLTVTLFKECLDTRNRDMNNLPPFNLYKLQRVWESAEELENWLVNTRKEEPGLSWGDIANTINVSGLTRLSGR